MEASLRAGVFLRESCINAGIGWTTGKRWLQRGRAGEEPFVEFAEAVERGKGAWIAESLNTIRVASADDWKAAAWLLEKRDRRFSPKLRHEVEKELSVVLAVLEKELPENEYERVLARIVEARDPNALPVMKLDAEEGSDW